MSKQMKRKKQYQQSERGVNNKHEERENTEGDANTNRKNNNKETRKKNLHLWRTLQREKRLNFAYGCKE